MKTGLGIYKKLRSFYAYCNLIRFTIRKKLIGFDAASQFIQRVDKNSVQLILKRNGATIGKDCDIETGLTFHNCKDYSNLIIGDNCHIGKNCFFDLRDKIIIGNNVTISMQCTFITHIDLGKSLLSSEYKNESNSIRILDDSYIATKCTILKGVRIGHLSIVAAGAVLTHDVSSKIIVGGIPAKKIKNIDNV